MESWLTRLKCKRWLFVARNKYERRHYEEALEILQKVIIAQPHRALAFVRAGLCFWNLNRHDEGINCYERALQIAPNYGDAHAYLSVTLHDLGRNQEALESLNRAVQIKPSLLYSEFWLYHLGFVRAEAKQGEQALTAFTKLTGLNHQHVDAWHGVGWANTNLEGNSDATAAYERVANLIPGNAVVHCDLGAEYLRLGRPKEALEHLQRSKELQPTKALTHVNLCRAHCDLKNFDCALSSVLEALRLDPKIEGSYLGFCLR